jgi:hypothetical protein
MEVWSESKHQTVIAYIVGHFSNQNQTPRVGRHRIQQYLTHFRVTALGSQMKSCVAILCRTTIQTRKQVHRQATHMLDRQLSFFRSEQTANGNCGVCSYQFNTTEHDEYDCRCKDRRDYLVFIGNSCSRFEKYFTHLCVTLKASIVKGCPRFLCSIQEIYIIGSQMVNWDMKVPAR